MKVKVGDKHEGGHAHVVQPRTHKAWRCLEDPKSLDGPRCDEDDKGGNGAGDNDGGLHDILQHPGDSKKCDNDQQGQRKEAG